MSRRTYCQYSHRYICVDYQIAFIVFSAILFGARNTLILIGNYSLRSVDLKSGLTLMMTSLHIMLNFRRIFSLAYKYKNDNLKMQITCFCIHFIRHLALLRSLSTLNFLPTYVSEFFTSILSLFFISISPASLNVRLHTWRKKILFFVNFVIEFCNRERL